MSETNPSPALEPFSGLGGLGAVCTQTAGLANHGTATAPQAVAVPPVQARLAYAACYWPLTLRNLLVPHRLNAGARPAFETRFVPPPDAQRSWCDAFGLDPVAAAGAPFLHAQAAGTVLYMRLFAALGLNFRHLLHLDHVSRHPQRPAGPAATAPQALAQTVSARLAGVVALGAVKVVLTVDSEVRDADHGLRLQQRDRFIVRGYRAAQLQGVPRDDALAQAVRAQARRAPGLGAGATQVLAVPVAADLGRRFAQVAGDANPVHTSDRAARLFGHRQPFLQGLATRNLVVGHLAAAGWAVGRIELHLCRPVLCAQTLRLAHDGQRFELLDPDARLLACGRFDAPLA